MGTFFRTATPDPDDDPRYKRQKGAAFGVPRPLTAAASRVKMSDKNEAQLFKARKSSQTALWQADAWEYYDAIAEVKYAFQLVANIVSRIRLYAAVVDEAGETPVSVKDSDTIPPDLADAAERALSRLDSAYGGQAGLLRDAALNLSVAGECYLVQVPERPGTGTRESWDIRSVDELQVTSNGTYQIIPRRDLLGNGSTARTGKGIIDLPAGAFMGRIWRAHPRFSEEPDSSMRGLLDLCNELLLINRTFRSTARSRLNAGAMYIPDGLSAAAAPDPNVPYDENVDANAQAVEEAADEFEEQLHDAMITPIEDESSAAAVAPLLIRGPAELAQYIKQFSFERSFDAALVQRSDRVLDRIIQGLDVPKDTVTGLANVKYSNAVQIDESLYKAHIEPMLLLISDALTVVYLRQYLKGLNAYDEADIDRIVVWYDPSAVATRNDRAADSEKLFDQGAINFEALRRAHGFTDADAPTSTEMVLRLIMKGTISPELTEAILQAVAPEIMNAAKAAGQASSVAPIPPEVQSAMGGEPGAPAAPTEPAAPPAEPAAPPAPPAEGAPPVSEVPTPPETTVEPGADAPPIPLAEPTDDNPA